jgi:hypothetical protein
VETSKETDSNTETEYLTVKKSELIKALQTEIRRHDLGTFVEDSPRITVPGCPACRKRLNTSHDFLEHLAVDVIPRLIERLSTEA